jgi:hypothetical protein
MDTFVAGQVYTMAELEEVAHNIASVGRYKVVSVGDHLEAEHHWFQTAETGYVLIEEPDTDHKRRGRRYQDGGLYYNRPLPYRPRR